MSDVPSSPYEILPPSGSRESDGSDRDRAPTWLERTAPTSEIPEALLGTGRICGGIVREYKARRPHVRSDFADGISWKTLSASIFMFCATITSTVALGDVAFRETGGMVGITEYLMLQGASGAFHSLFSACPMPVLRPTGPITAFMIDLYDLSGRVGVEYYSLLSWVGFWVGTFLVLIAVFDLSRYIALCSRFLHEIYAVFVCTIYITDGIIGARERFDKVEWSQAFFAGYLALFCILFSLGFYYVDRLTILNTQMRHAISDYAVPLAVLICIGISYAVRDKVEVARIEMPRNFEPTYVPDGEKRSWYQGFGDGGAAAAGVSAVAAVPIVALFYIDHLFSCILGQKPELGLKKGEYYHSSILITGVCNMILPSFGMPFVTASLPHSPQFTKALTEFDKTHTPWRVKRVHESRVAPTLVYVLCFCGLVAPAALETCPEGVVNGVLTFVGLQGVLPGTGNQLVDRCVLLLTAPSEFPESVAPYASLPWRRVHLYTAVQLTCLAACWGMRFAGPLSLAFPLVIVGFVPLRLYLLPGIFTEEELEALDSEEKLTASKKKEGASEGDGDDSDAAGGRRRFVRGDTPAFPLHELASENRPNRPRQEAPAFLHHELAQRSMV